MGGDKLEFDHPWRRSAAALMAAGPALLLTDGCTRQTDADGFRITQIDFDNASTITLTLTEPLAELGGVDPADFRISVGQTVRYTYVYAGESITYAYTRYTEAGIVVDGYYYFQDLNVASVAGGSASNQIVLTTDIALGPAACDWVEYQRAQAQMYIQQYGPDAAFEIGLFLHYASGDVPITAADGTELADIAPDWVVTEAPYSEREGYGFTARPLPIPCP